MSASFGRRPYNTSPKTGWRAKGFEDGFAGKVKRELGDEAARAAYLEGYRVGRRERERRRA